MPRLLIRATTGALLIALLLGLTPRGASADATQLCRSISSIVLAPTDIPFAPYIAQHDLYVGLLEQDDDWYKKVIATPPGVVWLLGLQAAGTVVRVVTGVMEFVPGLFTLFREEPQGALFRSQDEAWAVYSEDFGPCPVRIGTSYQTINEG